MTIDITILIAIIGSLIGIGTFYMANKKETIKESTEISTMMTKLDNIDSGVQEIKNELKNVKSDVKQLEHRITRIETINEMKGIHPNG